MISETRNTKSRMQNTHRFRAFTLVEMITSLIILGLICSSVLVVINRCIASAADSALRMQAFEVARDNMEELLASDAVSRDVEFGTSDKYPEIKWQNTIETFYEPITARMWIKGTCSAEYTDTQGELQKIELTHWLTDVTKQQMLEILKEQQTEQEQLALLVIGTIEEAAEYAGVDVETVEQWVDNGMLTTEDGSFVKDNLDTYKDSGGNPTPEAKSQQVESIEELEETTEQDTQDTAESKTEEQSEPEITFTREELEKKGFSEGMIDLILQLLNSD